MKKKFTLLAALAASLSFTALNAQTTYFTEYFDDGATGISGSSGTPSGPTGPVNVTIKTGTWTVNYAYRGGSGCTPNDPNVTSAKGVRLVKVATAGSAAPAYIQTFQLNYGVNVVSWKNAKNAGTPSASSAIAIYKSANGTSWNLVETPITTSTLCDGYSVTINDANAKFVRFANESNGDQDIDNITITSVNTIAPVKFSSVKAYLNNGGVKIDWNIAAEENVAEYIIERSASSNDFASVGSVKANNAKQYSYFDATPLSGNNFYRIKVLDKDGSVMYSNILKVNTVRGSAEMNVAPNPVKGNALNVQFAGIEKATYSLRLVNNVGQQVFVKTINGETSSFTQSFSLPATVAKGIYSLQLLSSTTKLEKKIIIE